MSTLLGGWEKNSAVGLLMIPSPSQGVWSAATTRAFWHQQGGRRVLQSLVPEFELTLLASRLEGNGDGGVRQSLSL